MHVNSAPTHILTYTQCTEVHQEHTHMHTHTHTYSHIHTHVLTLTSQTLKNTHSHAHTYTHSHAYSHIHTLTCSHSHTCIHRFTHTPDPHTTLGSVYSELCPACHSVCPLPRGLQPAPAPDALAPHLRPVPSSAKKPASMTLSCALCSRTHVAPHLQDRAGATSEAETFTASFLSPHPLTSVSRALRSEPRRWQQRRPSRRPPSPQRG